MKEKTSDRATLSCLKDAFAPLSFAQERLWLLDQFEASRAVYVIPAAVCLRGALDVAVLQQSLTEIVRRHAILRTTFVTSKERPVQIVSPARSVSLPLVDLSALPGMDREGVTRRLIAGEMRRPFDLAQGPLLRITLLRLSGVEHVLLLVLHHLVADEGSVDLFWQDLATLYAAFFADEPSRQAGDKQSPLPELPIQYADYATWQREHLQGEALETPLSYWRQRLDGAPTALEFPTDRSRPPVQTYRGASQSLLLAEPLSGRLKALSQQEGCTLSMTLLAAFKALLYRYTGQKDVVAGSRIARRERAEVQALIGRFEDTLVLRTNLSGQLTFRELLARVHEEALAADASSVPFEVLVDALQSERNLDRTPLFQVMFVFQNAPASFFELPGLILSPLEIDNGTAEFDLTLSLVDTGLSLKGSLNYNADLFNADTMKRLLDHLQVLLEGVVANPDSSLANLSLLTETERQRLLVVWNDVETGYPRDASVHQLFEAQVRQTPDAVALVFSALDAGNGADQHLTYFELNRRANQLAHYLGKLGVGPETLVGLCVERSIEMVVATLGILKTGGAYLPLDPTYPQERLAFMLQDAQAPILLAQERLLGRLDLSATRVVDLDRDWDAIAQQSADDPPHTTWGTHTIYVMYTSGSTGQPKGIAIPHRAVNRLVRDTSYIHLSSRDTLAQVSNISFDAATFELWGALLNGGRLVIFPKDVVLSLETFAVQIQAQRVSALFLTTALFNQFAQQMPAAFRSLRHLMFGGQAVAPRWVREVLEHGPPERLLHVYGPTESTTFATWYLVTEVLQGATTVPIGRPVSNTSLYVLDQNLHPVPEGVPGELCIGGEGLAHGYVGRPALTAEKFIPNPFSLPSAPPPLSPPLGGMKGGRRLYRTGDLVRYLPDGSIEFLGRFDHQVKLRGFRVELGEIEAVLAQHPAVREAVVLAREDPFGGKQLVAYLVPSDGQAPPWEELRQFMQQKLPDYMLPAAFVSLDAFPLTPNGKVDRRALPAPERSRFEGEILVAPRTPTEEMLAGIWSQVLRLGQVSVYDNFFALGGHSLLATQVVSRLRQLFQVEVSLLTFFEAPTVASLAEHLEAAQRIEIPPIVPVPHAGDLPLSFAQQRLWFVDQLEPGNPFYNIPFVLHLVGPLDVAALAHSLNEIVRRHQALRTTFVVVNGQPTQVIASTLSVSLPLVDVWDLPKARQEAQVERLIVEEARRPFCLAQGPLLRAAVLRLDRACPVQPTDALECCAQQGRRDEHILLVTMHHVISDGWSLGVFTHEIAALYPAFVAGEPSWRAGDKQSLLPELPIQYADFTLWQRAWLRGEVLEAQLSYWRRQLAAAPITLELPTDRPRPALQTFRGRTQALLLPEALSGALKALSQQEGVTLFMTLLAAFKVLLFRYTGQDDIVVGTPIANRNRGEIEGLIGFFVNTLVLRTDLRGNPSFRELLHRVRKVTLGAYAHQDLPFEVLVEKLQPERDLSRNPLFQIMFVLQNAPAESLVLPGLTLRPLEVDNQTAKFDLTLYMMETKAGLEGSFEYNTDLFDAGTVSRLADHYRVLLGSVVAHADQTIVELPLFTKAASHRLLVEWNDTEVAYSQDVCLHELFEAQAERTPDRVALLFQDQHLTYHELNCCANQLAHHLQGLGVGPEVLVGVCVERTPEMVLGLLGILKAGGVYVPLDPAYPQERLAFILGDTRAPLLLTQQHLLGRLPAPLLPTPYSLLLLDTDWSAIAFENETNPAGGITSGNVAYVIYTSGSTGRPKGVAIQHNSAVALVHWAQGVFSPDLLAGMLASTSICFDLSVFELFVPLSCGGTVMLAETVLHLLNLPAAAGVTLINTVPSAMRELLRSDGMPASVRVVNLAGEPLSTRLVRQIYQGGTVQQVFDLYGPSEDTTYSTYALRRAAGPDTIGRPIANTQVYLLDAHLNPVPVGVPGELYSGGVGLARGYFCQPGLTAERFIAHPFPPSIPSLGGETRGGERLYRTGDLARYLPDGNIEFLGRSDHQVKVRGYRIELGEIEKVLGQHPAVQEAVVLARQDRPDDLRLVAYVVPAVAVADSLDPAAVGRQPSVVVGELRRFLRDKLPDYMLPATFVTLEALPLTLSGKVDRRVLPAPDRVRPEPDGIFVAPRTPAEQVLAGIWADVLGLEQVSVRDNFFELGGHSLLATQVVSRIRDTWKVEPSLRRLFDLSTIAELAGHIEATRQAEQGLLAPPIVPLAPADELPLSFAQQRLWFIDQWEPDSIAYIVPSAIHLAGLLDVFALQHSLAEIMRRHKALRTTFIASGEQPVQVVAPARPVPLPLLDLCALPKSQREAEIRQIIAGETWHPFNLAQGPLLRVTLLRLGEQEHVLLLTMHHIVSDAWSLGVFWRELAALYTSFSADKLPRQAGDKLSPLPELPAQYTDYTVWQREWLQGEVLEAQLSYWKRQLAGIPAVLELPTDRPRPAVQSFRGATQSLLLPEALSGDIKTLSRREDVTLFMTLLTAFKVLLCRYTGQDDVAVGTPIANRNRSEVEGLIGFFVNTLVLRADLEDNPSFRELLRRVREVTLDAYAHQDLPFEVLVERLQPERDLSRNPLFQVMFAIDDVVPIEAVEFPGLTAETLEIDFKAAKFDLTLAVKDTEQGLVASVEYNTDLFDPTTITRLLNHWHTLLDSVVADPEQRVSELQFLTQAERRQMLVEWNDTWIDYSQDRCIHELFETQVARTPDAVAVIFASQILSFRELNRRANQLAHYLQALGVGPETLVGVCAERSLEAVLGLLGILKAGGVYVPLDPEYPQERLAFMIADTRMPVLLTQERLADRLPNQPTTICLDADWDLIAQESQKNPASAVMADNLAYAIYTSGSTGAPKGVMISHRSICSRMHWGQIAYPLTSADRVLKLTSFSFDVSVWEFFKALLTGAALVMSQPDRQRDSAYVVELIGEQKVSIAGFVPSMLQVLLEQPNVTSCSCLRYVFSGGEALPAELERRFFSLLDGELLNLYGPTETCIDATLWHCERESQRPNVPIGHPVGNTQTYVLDRHLQPVPIGVPGELHVGGVGLARGYLNWSHLTAEKFIPHPFLPSPSGFPPAGGDERGGARLYKTGDLARYLPDGSVEFLGRIDHQVKVRGFRIELEEIEAMLRQHASVKEVVVVVRDGAAGDRRLVACVLLEQGQTPTAIKLRGFLQERLPEYMLPTAFVTVDAFPLTPSGKVDRRALHAPELDKLELQETFVAPRTPIEEVLAGMWAEILGLEQVGVHDNFFALGGHSLLVTQVVFRARDALQVELSLRDLFESPTVARLAERVEVVRRTEQGLLAPPIVPVPRDVALPLSFAQQRLWFLDQWEPGNSAYNIPAAVRVTGSLDVAVLRQTLDEIVRRHEVLRTNFVTVEGQPVQVIALARALPLPVINLGALPAAVREDEVRRLAAQENRRPFDLARDLLLRATLLCLDQKDYVVFLTMHHIISDGWSTDVFTRELSAFYRAFCAGEPASLPELPIQYVDFATWQRQWLQGEVLDTQLSYWMGRLAGASKVLDLPFARPRPPVQSFRGTCQPVALSVPLSEALRALSQREGVTLFMTLLAAFKVLLHCYTGQDDISVGTPIAGRSRTEVENLIGFFVNTLVLHTSLQGNPSFRELLSRVRETTLGAYIHQDLPFEMLVEKLLPRRDLSRSPLFQVMFTIQDVATEVLELPGLALRPMRVESRTARFDLTLGFLGGQESLLGSLEYNTDLFDAATIARMVEHLQTLLESIVADPEQPISSLALMPESESQQLLAKWSGVELEQIEDAAAPSEQAAKEQDVDQIVSQRRVQLSTKQAGLSAAKKALLERRLRGRIKRAPKPPVIPRRSGGGPAPLSFAQQRLWFLSQLMPDSSFYNVPIAFRIAGALDVAVLRRALSETVRRHEILRTTFGMLDEQPLQIVAPARPASLPVLDLSALPRPERETQAQRWADEEAQRSFDLVQGPLLRAVVLRLEEAEHVFVLTLHHIITDGWSINLLWEELLLLYGAFSNGRGARQAGDKQSPLPELPVQYADYAVWQRERLQGEVLESQLAYWREQLGGASLVLELPTDRPRPALQSFRGDVCSVELSEDLGEAVRALSRREGVSLFTTLLAAFKVLLYRYTGQEDVSVGTVVAGREQGGVEKLIGFFVNTLVLRTDVGGGPSFRELLARVRETVLGAFAHQDVPFEMLVDELQPQRDLSRSPLFQVMFTLQSAPGEALKLPGLAMSVLEVENKTAKFDLTLIVTEMERGLSVLFEYNSDLFEADTIERLGGHFRALLEGIAGTAEGLERRISELPLLTQAEQRRLLVEWNDTRKVYPDDVCIQQLFEAQVERTPDAIAVVFEDGWLTYRELNRQANRLAHYVQKLGVGPETLVGICVERSPDMVLGLLGILKAGGAYVPLDPDYPQERLAFILQDTRAPLLLTRQHLLERLPASLLHTSYSLLLLDTGWPAITEENDTNPTNSVTAGNLAYVIYTSGSTGKPKGVLLQHRGLCNLVNAQIQTFGVEPESRVLQFASFSFDASLSEIFMALLTGASLHLVRRETLLSATDLVQTLRDLTITTVTLPPVLLSVLPADGLPGLRTVVSAGESCSWGVASRWSSGRRFFNAYGPTEATIGPTLYQVEGAQGGASVPIGRPIANTRAYVLDRHLQPVPPGVPGELHLGGVGLARGYLERPELTVEKFVPDPFGDTVGARLYKTGDLVRRLPAGEIEFLGRVDYQVKVRGYRIELGEIETALRQHPAVRETVILVREEGAGDLSSPLKPDKRLVAYVVLSADGRPSGLSLRTKPPTADVGELRSYLKDKLPDCMLPSAFVTLDALPLTPSGKVDRRSLPALEEIGLDLAQTLVAPRDALELRLVRIWEDVLGVRPIGVTHNFFELGGHSILALRLLARIQRELGQELPLTTLFQDPTVEQQAALLRQWGDIEFSFSSLVPLQTGQPERQPLFLVHPGGGSVLCYGDLVRHLGPGQPVYGFQSQGLDESHIACTQVEAMAQHYVGLLQSVQPQGPYQLGGWSIGGVIAMEMAQQLQAQDQDVVLLALIDSYAPTGDQGPEPNEITLLMIFAQDMGLPWRQIPLASDHLARLEPDQQLACALEQARRANVVPPDMDLARVRRLFQVFKNNFWAVRQYVPHSYSGAVTLFKACEQLYEEDVASDLGWGVLVDGGVTVHEIAGNHYTLVREPHVEALAGALRKYLFL